MNKIRMSRFFIILGIILGITGARWWFIYEKPLFGIDDANIYFVYAKNFAEGHGFVYNVGGEKVEGFTSIIWTLLLSLFYKLGHMEFLAASTSLVLTAFTLHKATGFINFLHQKQHQVLSLPCILFLGFVCLIPGYLDWTVFTMMETALWSFLLVTTFVNLLYLFFKPDDKVKAYSLLYLLPLLVFTRPESMVWGLVFLFIRFAQLFYLKLIKGSKFSSRQFIAPTLLFMGSLIVLFVFRLSYFGYLLPNTFYAKVSHNTTENLQAGFYYVLRYVKENPFIPIFIISLAASVILILLKIRKRNKEVDFAQLSIALVCGISFFIPFYTGGDHFYFSRFYQPLYPVLLIGVLNFRFWQTFIRFQPTQNKLYFPAIFFLFAVLLASSGRFSLFEQSPIKKEFDIATKGREAGKKLNHLFSETGQYPRVGTYVAGGLAYTYKGETVDLLGLNNSLMAHAKGERKGYKNHSAFNKEVFYKLAPDIVHVDFVEDRASALLNEQDSTDFQNQVLQYIFLDQEFKNKYKPILIEGNDKKTFYLSYISQQYLEKLKGSQSKLFVINQLSYPDPQTHKANLSQHRITSVLKSAVE